ncbi:superoxide dismutase [Campylobacter sp. MIT 12-5580]|uniref:superoxide dismutase n=1 Tax=Campylobacter sp. MIT 12-5580 TaxID=2040651 RepID=UPI0010F800F6|nr:superoxide dismutase [Campylobacter sp. MIT 12-5580]TKX29765.1 superoxide dismutase [Campylobacter sp. MIT 12-5580]
MFKLRTLPYDTSAFGQFLSEEAFSYHHGKHHKAYVDNLNKLIKDTEFENKDLFFIIKNSSAGLFNNAAQIYNHDFYFDCLSPKSDEDKINPAFNTALEKEFNSLAEFKAEFIKGASGVFGSGWFWLVYDLKDKKLKLLSTPNAATPITEARVPLLVADVWEHAYYINHRNARAAYLEAFFEYVNWEFVAKAYEWALKEGEGSVQFYINELHS